MRAPGLLLDLMTLNTTFAGFIMPEIVKTIQKTYTSYVKFIEYRHAWKPRTGLREKKKRLEPTPEHLKQLRSVLRAKSAIHDLVACNQFEYFVTLTISPQAPFDRYDYDQCVKFISKWLNNHLNHYILVPEKHKDGAFHFHLLADLPLSKLKKHTKKVYNIKSYKYGHSTAISIEQGTEHILAKYIRKYITKDLMTTVGKNRRMYWHSKDLKKPVVDYNVVIPPDAELVWEMEHLKVLTKAS